MEFSQRLKELRKSRNLTQKEVADLVGMSQTAYQKYEYGTREPAFQKLSALADCFNVSVDYLLGVTEELYEQPETDEGFVKESYIITATNSQLKRLIKYLKDNGIEFEFDSDNKNDSK